MRPQELCADRDWGSDDYCFKCERWRRVTYIEFEFGGIPSQLPVCPLCYFRLWQLHWVRRTPEARRIRAERASRAAR